MSSPHQDHSDSPNTSTVPHVSTATCHDYCCSAFALTVNEPVRELEILSNAIHPIFRPANFNDEFDYSILKPCLQLATHLLESSALVGFLNTLMDGEIRDLDGKQPAPLYEDIQRGLRWHSIWPKPGQDRLCSKTKSRARRILQQMVDMVHFELSPTGETHSWYGQCAALEGPLLKRLSRAFPCGTQSIIWLNRQDYVTMVRISQVERILPAFDVNGTRWDRCCLLDHRFSLAVTFVHEIVHALEQAARGSPFAAGDIFYEDHNAVETGFEVEARLFGGTITSQICWMKGAFVQEYYCEESRNRVSTHSFLITAWPSHSLVDHSLFNLDKFSWSGRDFANHDVFWTIPTKFIQDLFSDSF